MSDVKKAAQSGAFEPFLEVVKEVVARQEDFSFGSANQNAYNLGKRDLARNFLAEIEETIKQYCK